MSDRQTLTREELYERVWKEPITKLAKEFGLSDRGLAKLCERNGIPVPPRGSWARRTAGQQVNRPPLLAIKGGGDQTIVLSRHWRSPSAGSGADDSDGPYRTLMERELQDSKQLPVAKTLRNPHQIVERWLKEEEIDVNRWRSNGIHFAHTPRYGTPLEKRRLRILSALFRALEGRGFILVPDEYRPMQVSARFGQDAVSFTLTERIRHQRRPLTEDECKGSGYSKREWTQTRETTGELVLKIKSSAPRCLPESWRDQPENPLEQQLSKVLVGFIVTAAYLQNLREAREEERRNRWKVEQEAHARAEERKAAAARQATLRLHTRSWVRATELRAYISAIRAAIGNGSITAPPEEAETWLAWADTHADQLDPICSGRTLSLVRLDIDEDERPVETPLLGRHF